MQDTEDRADDTAAPADQPAPSAEGQAAAESRASLSEEARIESNLAAGIRNRLAGSSERPTRGAQARAQADDSDADDEDDDEEDSPPSGAAASAIPATEPAPTSESQQATEPVDRSRLKGRALLRYDLKVANERAAQLERERDEQVAAVTVERDQAVQQAGAVQSRYREIKPKEAAAVLEDREYERLEYIEQHGGLTFDDQQKLDTARVLREYRQVWIEDRDAAIAERLGAVKSTFQGEALQSRDRWSVKPEAIAKATSFEAMFDTFGQAGYSKAKAEDAERIAQLETDNRALSARNAGREAHAPELGGRSAPLDQERPGPNASPEEKMAAGIRERLGGGRRNGRTPVHA